METNRKSGNRRTVVNSEILDRYLRVEEKMQEGGDGRKVTDTPVSSVGIRKIHKEQYAVEVPAHLLKIEPTVFDILFPNGNYVSIDTSRIQT